MESVLSLTESISSCQPEAAAANMLLFIGIPTVLINLELTFALDYSRAMGNCLPASLLLALH